MDYDMMLKVEERIKRGFIDAAGVHYNDFRVAEMEFCDSDVLQEAAKDFGTRFLAAKLPLDFHIDEVVPLTVRFAITPDEIQERAGLNPTQWEFKGKTFSPDRPPVDIRVAVGKFNKWLTGEQALAWLREHPERCLRGSGAWVREAYLGVRPFYDGEDELGFLDEGDSWWKDCFGEKPEICFPGLWHDGGRMGARSMNALTGGWRVGKRFAFVVAD